MSLNKITLSGNLGADAELRYTKSGNHVVSFSLAVNERTPNGDGSWGEYTNWPDCVMFGKRAEALAPWLRKGTKISLIGRIHTRSYQNDGKSIKRWEVRVDDVELMQYKRTQPRPVLQWLPATHRPLRQCNRQRQTFTTKTFRFKEEQGCCWNFSSGAKRWKSCASCLPKPMM